MRMDLGLTQTIKQIQTLSPQMYMSMEILCLNSLDLEERIDRELEENIALELSEGPKAELEPGEAASGEASATLEAGVGEPAAAATVGETAEAADAFDRKVEQWDSYAREEYDFQPGSRTGYDGEKDEKLEALNNTEGRPMSLQEYLEQQVHLLRPEAFGADPEMIIDLAIAIIYNIDDRGYLLYSPDEIYESLVRESESVHAPADPTPGGAAASAPALNGHPGGADGAVTGRVGPVVGAESSAPPAGANGLEAAPVPSPAASSPLDPRRGTSGGAVRELALPAAAPESPPLPGRAAASPRRQDHDPGEESHLSRAPTREEIQRALALVQSLDPPGVGGRDLRECLLLQLKRDGQLYPVETRIIENHLEDLGNNRLPKIAKSLGIAVEEVKAAAETIASLNPIPGKLFGGEPARFIKPDVVVEEVDGRYEVRVDSEHLPRLQVSAYYRDLYRKAYQDAELKKFVKKKLESAEWLISAIRQRQSTLQRIAQEIVEIQKGFLDHGISHLKPLKMVEVAERVGVHVSTISRALSGKYMQTPRGIFDMKFFFTGGAVKSDGTVEARGSVIQRIKDLIDSEDKQSPLSDIDIVKKLEEFDIRISRRTVTKYREAENIPSSRQRRAY